jgi:NAD(P)-dependent dehydrogenase (short-subunit alcohol dehydrogenase family)
LQPTIGEDGPHDRSWVGRGTDCGGSIVAIASVDGFSSSRFHAAYGAAKAGLISLIKTYSDEFGPYGIRVNCVAPGNVGGGVWDKPDVGFGEDPMNTLAHHDPLISPTGCCFWPRHSPSG